METVEMRSAKRKVLNHRYAFNTGDGSDSCAHFPVITKNVIPVRIAISIHDGCESQDIVKIEPRIDIDQTEDAFRKQGCSDDQNECQGDLTGDEQVAGSRMDTARSRLAGLFNGVDQIRS